MLQRSGLTVAFMVIAMTVSASAMSAATLTVTNLNDSGAGSLRDQLAVAAATAAADNIVFQASLSGTITLVTSELSYNSITSGNDISIDGTVTAGQITVSGNNAVRCFGIGVSGGAWTISLANLIVTNGRATSGGGGGGITVYSSTVSISLSNVTIANCTTTSGNGGGLEMYQGAAVTLSNCVFNNNSASNYGGGISTSNASGVLFISGCTFSGNSAAANGGGAYINGIGGGLTHTVSNCTFSGNGANQSAGVAFNATPGSTMNVSGCTFSGNTAAISGGGFGGVIGAGSAPAVTMNFTNCTVSGNTCNGTGAGGGIHAGTLSANDILMVTLTNCTIANNTSATPANGISISSDNISTGTVALSYRNTIITGTGNTNIVATTGGVTFTSQNNNLCSDATGNLIGANDLPSTAANLGALANNGGPTQTHMPQPGSAAIDNGRAIGGITTDERGVTRPLDHPGVANASNGDGSDIGAVEAPIPPTLTNVNPAIGPLAGGQSVTLTGTNFTGVTSVTFAGAAAANVIVVSATSITCDTPSGTAGTASVIVNTPGGSNAANSLYTYQAAPTVTLVAPASGPIAGGTAVTITGTDFTGATDVSFGGTSQPVFTVVSGTSITCNTPAHASGAVSVVVTTPAGANAANTLFTYVAPEMDVTRTVAIASGGTDTQTGAVAGTSIVLTYTIANSGNSILTMTLPISINGLVNCTCTVTTAPATATVAAAANETFTITITPTAAGNFSASVSITNDDADENPYNWTISGTAIASGGGGGGDGGSDSGGCSTGDGNNALPIFACIMATIGLALRLRRRID